MLWIRDGVRSSFLSGSAYGFPSDTDWYIPRLFEPKLYLAWTVEHLHKALKSLPCGSAGKESACSAGDLGLIPGLGRSPGEGKGYPL